jgi:hypothetical protein
MGTVASARVTGTIRDAASGLPVAGAEVRAAAEAGEVATARTDARGAFALTVVWEGEGEATVHLEARGVAHAAEVWPRLDTPEGAGRAAPGGALTVDLALKPGFTLALDLVDAAGRPVEGASVDVVENNTVANACTWPLHHRWLPPAQRRATSDAAGHVEIPGLCDLEFGWRYFVSIGHPDRAEGMLDRPEQLPREAGVARARVVLVEGHTVAGVLRGGRPAEGAIATALVDPRIPGCHSVTRFATFDAEGRFRITGLHAGKHTLHASAPGAASVVRTVEVPPAGPLAIDLAPARHVRGTVIGADGDPLAGARVTAEWPGGHGYRETATDARGVFSLGGMPADQRIEIAAFVDAPSYGEGVGFTVLDARGEDVDLVFDARTRVAWRGRLHDDRTGAPVEGDVMVRAVPRGTQVRFFAHGSAGDGRFTILLPPGAYALGFEGMGAFDATCAGQIPDATVVAGEARDDLRVEAAACFRVPVRVIDAATGAPLAGAAVTAQPPDLWGRVYLGNTGEDGIFAIDPAMEVPVRLVAEAQGYARSAVVQVDLRRGMDPIVVALARA